MWLWCTYAAPHRLLSRMSAAGLESLPTPVEPLDLRQLGSMLRQRRGDLSLRQAAAEAGVSFSTFTRVEGGSQPDLTSFTLLCAWLGVPPAQFFGTTPERDVEPIEEAIAHLTSDPRLAPGAAEKITDVLRAMYDNLASAAERRAPIACHLRAAAVMRPGVPERLDTLLVDLNRRLEERVAAGEL